MGREEEDIVEVVKRLWIWHLQFGKASATAISGTGEDERCNLIFILLLKRYN